MGEEAKPETEEKVDKPKSLFDFTPSSNVFGNLLKNPAGLFATGGPSIFSFNSNVPPTTLAEAKKDEGESDEEGYKEESAEIDESKVINDYVYDLPYTKLIEVCFASCRNRFSSTNATLTKLLRTAPAHSSNTSRTRRCTCSFALARPKRSFIRAN